MKFRHPVSMLLFLLLLIKSHKTTNRNILLVQTCFGDNSLGMVYAKPILYYVCITRPTAETSNSHPSDWIYYIKHLEANLSTVKLVARILFQLFFFCQFKWSLKDCSFTTAGPEICHSLYKLNVAFLEFPVTLAV